MSFIVKGLNMPKDGNSIDISVQDSGAVLVKSSEGYYEFKGNIAVEIPTPHGRLIDGDKLRAEFRDMAEMEWNKRTMPLSWSYAYEDAINEIDLATTIIEAEREVMPVFPEPPVMQPCPDGAILEAEE